MAMVYVVKGNSEAIGQELALKVKDTLKQEIDGLLTRVQTLYGLDEKALAHGASQWFYALDDSYQEELVSLSKHAGVSLDLLTRSYYFDCALGCSSFIAPQSRGLMIGRNNDFIYEKAWGHITKIYKMNKIPCAIIGLKGSLFGSTGYNAEKLWIHGHYLESDTRDIKAMSTFVFIRKALEQAKTIKDVDLLLNDYPVDGSMQLIVADGKSQEAVIFEVHHDKHETYPYRGFPLFVTNHSFHDKNPQESSINRYKRLKERLRFMPVTLDEACSILGDEKIEQRTPESHTVYACVVDLVNNTMRFAYDHEFAASEGTWETQALTFDD